MSIHTSGHVVILALTVGLKCTNSSSMVIAAHAAAIHQAVATFQSVDVL